MKYFIAFTTIKDNFEYTKANPVKAKSEAAALELAEEIAKAWAIHGDREYWAQITNEITKKEFAVISKYIHALEHDHIHLWD
jgi:hypothetical protein